MTLSKKHAVQIFVVAAGAVGLSMSAKADRSAECDAALSALNTAHQAFLQTKNDFLVAKKEAQQAALTEFRAKTISEEKLHARMLEIETTFNSAKMLAETKMGAAEAEKKLVCDS